MNTDNFIAIYNIAPILPGHSLIIPKFHFQSYMDLNESMICELFVFAQKVIEVLLKAFNCDGFNLTIQDGANAGQTVNHLHLHLIPRKDKDLPQPGDWYPLLESNRNQMIIDSSSRNQMSQSELLSISDTLRKIAKSIKHL